MNVIRRMNRSIGGAGIALAAGILLGVLPAAQAQPANPIKRGEASRRPPQATLHTSSIRLALTTHNGGSRRNSIDFTTFSRTRKVKVYFVNLDHPQDRSGLTAEIWANKRPLPPSDLGKDQRRSPRFAHGQEITIGKRSRTPGEVGNYVGALKTPLGLETFFRRNPNAELLIVFAD